MDEKFDFEAALKALQSGQPITGKGSVLAPLVKQLTVNFSRREPTPRKTPTLRKRAVPDLWPSKAS